MIYCVLCSAPLWAAMFSVYSLFVVTMLLYTKLLLIATKQFLFLFGCIYFTGNILVATDRLELLCGQSKIWSRGMTQYLDKGHFVRKTLPCSWCNHYVFRLLCQWFSVRLSPSTLPTFVCFIFRLCLGVTFMGLCC